MMIFLKHVMGTDRYDETIEKRLIKNTIETTRTTMRIKKRKSTGIPHAAANRNEKCNLSKKGGGFHGAQFFFLMLFLMSTTDTRQSRDTIVLSPPNCSLITPPVKMK